VRAGGGDAHHDRHAAAHFLDDALDHAPPLLVGEPVGLAGDTEQRDTGDARGEGGFDEARQPSGVEVAAIRERRRHDVKDARPLDHQNLGLLILED